MMVHIFDVPFLRRWWRQPLRIPTTDLGGGGPTRYLDHILDFVGISFLWGHFIAFIIYCADLPFLSIARRFCDGRPSLYIGPSFYDDSLALPSSNDSNTCDGCSPLHNSRKFRDGCPSLRIARRFRDRHNTFLHHTEVPWGAHVLANRAKLFRCLRSVPQVSSWTWIHCTNFVHASLCTERVPCSASVPLSRCEENQLHGKLCNGRFPTAGIDFMEIPFHSFAKLWFLRLQFLGLKKQNKHGFEFKYLIFYSFEALLFLRVVLKYIRKAKCTGRCTMLDFPPSGSN